MTREYRWPEPGEDRATFAKRLRAEGLIYEEIGRHLGVTGSRAFAIVKAAKAKDEEATP